MKFKYTGLIVIMIAVLMSSCKETRETFEDPYAGGTPALGIVVDPQQVPVPSSGLAGTTVTIAVKGLMPYTDKVKVLFNGEEAQDVKVTETGVTATVPERASTGITSFVVDGQVVFGPDFTVLGKVNKDFTYKVVNGTNDAILKMLNLPDGNTLFLGNFTNFDNKGLVKPIYRIARTLPDGTYDNSLKSGVGANGSLYGMQILNGYWFIAGGFSGYAQRDGISNIAKLSNQGQIDTVQVPTYENKSKYVSNFNGGTDGYIHDIYQHNGKLIVAGGFTYYLSRRYDQPSYKYKDSVVVDSIDMRQLARLNTDGSLDKTWRFDPNAIGYKGLLGKGLPGPNGTSYTLMHDDGKILVWGKFNKFDDASVNNIVRLKADGTIDETFNPGGSGADEAIARISYNAKLNKYLAVGNFKTFNGVASDKMVLLNYDGSVDESFKPKVFESGLPNYCKLLDDGLAVVNGDFRSYDGASRNGFLITDITGGLAPTYNTIGGISGYIYDILETKSADGRRALLIGGTFYLFDGQPTNNLIRVTLE